MQGDVNYQSQSDQSPDQNLDGVGATRWNGSGRDQIDAPGYLGAEEKHAERRSPFPPAKNEETTQAIKDACQTRCE